MHAANRTKSRGTIFYAGGPSKSLKIGPGGPHKMGDQIFYDRSKVAVNSSHNEIRLYGNQGY